MRADKAVARMKELFTEFAQSNITTSPRHGVYLGEAHTAYVRWMKEHRPNEPTTTKSRFALLLQSLPATKETFRMSQAFYEGIRVEGTRTIEWRSVEDPPLLRK